LIADLPDMATAGDVQRALAATLPLTEAAARRRRS
jgi:hypothetical protein